MADAIPPMIIDIQLQTDQLKAQMSNLESKFNNLGNTVNKAQTPFKNFGTTIKTLLPAVGLTGLVMFTKQVIAAGEESKKSDARLQQIATSMQIFGGGVSQVTGRLKDYADAMARQTGVDDDVIKKTQAKLLTFRELALSANNLGGAFDRATAAAVDMAAAGFGDATSNAVQLGKALNDPIKGVTALTRSGITFTEAEKAKIATMVKSNQMLDAQKFVLEAIEKQVGGTAKATASATDRMKQAYGQVQEAIGLALLPMLEKFADWFTSVAPKIEAFFKSLNDPTTAAGKRWAEFTKQVKDSFKFIVDNAEAIKNWAVAVGTIVVAYKAYKTAVLLAKDAQLLFNITLSANPIMAAVGAVALLVIGFQQLKTAIDNIPQKDAASAANNAANKAGQAAYDAYIRKAKRQQTSTGPGSILPSEIAAAEKARADAYAKAMAGTKPGIKDNLNAGAAARAAAAAAGAGTVGTYAGYDGGAKGVDKAAKARAAADAKFVSALRATQKAITAANDDYNKAVQAANDKYGALIQQYSDEMSNIVQTSMNRIRDVFKNAVATDVGSIFKDLLDKGKGSADDLLASLKAKLAASKKLADNAAALAGMGYSQTFIEQVLAQGPDVGNQLSEMLKDATPETAKQIRELFGQSENLANSGMDRLAKELYEKGGLATAELQKLYEAANANMLKAQEDLAKALVDAATILNDSLMKIQEDFEKSLETMAASAAKHAKTIADTLARIANGRGAAPAAPAAPRSGNYGPGESAGSQFGSDTPWARAGASLQITNNVQTNASAALIADTTVAAIKYGMPMSKLLA